MAAILRQTLKQLLPLAFARKRIRSLVKGWRFRKEFKSFLSLTHDHRFPIRWEDRDPHLEDGTASTPFDRHYIYHTAWAARVLDQIKPSRHVDISSSLYFAAIASAFIPIRYYDFRPPELRVSNLSVEHADLLALPFEDHSISSLSCMHVVEHIGLGRYGDPLDPEGDLKAIRQLERVLAPMGDLMFVVPVGRPRIVFNAHRIYSYEQILDYFHGLRLVDFALIPDDEPHAGILSMASSDIVNRQAYACGCFWFRKQAEKD